MEEAERLSYKWLYMVTKAFVDFNGIVVEKYDVTRPIDPHKVVRTCRSWFSHLHFLSEKSNANAESG